MQEQEQEVSLEGEEKLPALKPRRPSEAAGGIGRPLVVAGKRGEGNARSLNVCPMTNARKQAGSAKALGGNPV